MTTEAAFGPWRPLTPLEVDRLLRPIGVPYWIAGGCAIEAFVGRAFRVHDDIDVGIFRDDQLRVQSALAAWNAHCADPPGTLRPWRVGETLAPDVHDVWLRETGAAPWRFQLMLNERDGADWVSRRDPRTRVPVTRLVFERDGLPYLAPEVQLLFKAKDARVKDVLDFEQALPLLSRDQTDWLRRHLARERPGHPWLVRL